MSHQSLSLTYSRLTKKRQVVLCRPQSRDFFQRLTWPLRRTPLTSLPSTQGHQLQANYNNFPSHHPNSSSETSIPAHGNARISIRESSAESDPCRVRNLGARMGSQTHPSHSDTVQSAQARANSDMPNQEGSLDRLQPHNKIAKHFHLHTCHADVWR